MSWSSRPAGLGDVRASFGGLGSGPAGGGDNEVVRARFTPHPAVFSTKPGCRHSSIVGTERGKLGQLNVQSSMPMQQKTIKTNQNNQTKQNKKV